jgi:hypothetical protein
MDLKMKKYFLLIFCLSSSMLLADESSSKKENSNQKYCFYAGKIFSKGSIMIQEGFGKICLQKNNQNKVLVWKDYSISLEKK